MFKIVLSLQIFLLSALANGGELVLASPMESAKGRRLTDAEVRAAQMVDARDFEFDARRFQALLQKTMPHQIASVEFERTSTWFYENIQSVYPGARMFKMKIQFQDKRVEICTTATFFDARNSTESWPEFLIFGSCSVSKSISAWSLGWRVKSSGVAYFWD